MPETITTRDHDREAEYLGAHATAFALQGHLRDQGRISGLSDDEARRQLQEARATMARLMPAPVGDIDHEGAIPTNRV